MSKDAKLPEYCPFKYALRVILWIKTIKNLSNYLKMCMELVRNFELHVNLVMKLLAP